MSGPRKSGAQQSFTVPAVSGGYAAERLRFGDVGEGQPRDQFDRVTVVGHSSATDADVELWLLKWDAVSPYTNDDYTFSGQKIDATGVLTVELAGYPGGEIRVKSGGNAGTNVVSLTASGPAWRKVG